MSQQFFPSTEELLDIVMAELPAGVYASDRADDPNPDKRSYTSAEVRAHMVMIADLYTNLFNIYRDKFVTTVTLEGLPSWEADYFSSAQDSSLPYATRQQNLLAKIRANGGISLPAIQSVVDGILTPKGLAFDILPYSGQTNGVLFGAWIFESSKLGADTFLALRDPLWGARTEGGLVPLDCNLDYAAAGLTAQDLLDIQFTAYAYEVRIFGNADALTLSLLDRQLTALEPARSTHIIRNNSTGSVPP